MPVQFQAVEGYSAEIVVISSRRPLLDGRREHVACPCKPCVGASSERETFYASTVGGVCLPSSLDGGFDAEEAERLER